MKDFEFVDTNPEPTLKQIKLVRSNLWMEPTTKKSDLDYWVARFKDQRIPFALVKFDTTLLNSAGRKMYRRVYGIFIDMKSWEKNNAELQTDKK